MNTYKIESNVPFPMKVESRLPFVSMKAGDSFYVPEAEMPVNTVRTYASRYLKNHPEVWLRVRKCQGGCRVWRIQRGPS